MHNGLSQIGNAFGLVRRTLVTASLVAAIGLAGLAGARTVEHNSKKNTSAGHIRPTKKTSRNVELLRDIEPDQVAAESSVRTVMMEVTAYCACPKCCGPDAIGLTASGKDITY